MKSPTLTISNRIHLIASVGHRRLSQLSAPATITPQWVSVKRLCSTALHCRNMHTMNVSMLNHSPDDLNDRKENLRQLMTVRLEQKTETINILRFHFGFRVKSHMEMNEMIMCVRAGELIESFTLLFW